MTKNDLLAYLKKPCAKQAIIRLARNMGDDPSKIQGVIELTFDNDATVAFRAAWLLEYCMLSNPLNREAVLPSFFNLYPRQLNQSCRRHYTKILMFYTDVARQRCLSQFNVEPLVEATFEWLIDPDTPVAVRVNCMDILFNLRKTTDWLHDELKAQISYFLKDGSAALQSRGKRLLKRLK